MQKLVFYLIYPPVWLLSKMPFWILYRVSDFVYFIVFYLFGYRRELVLSNLKTFFPEKSEKELVLIQKKSYHHFVDIFLEMIKTFTISQKELDKHFTLTNNELLDAFAQKGQSVIIMGSHYANWEWTIKIGQGTDFKRYGVYTKIQNKIISEKIKYSRERFGLSLIEKSETVKTFSVNHNENRMSVYGFLSDQSPQLSKSFYWSEFLGKRVPILTGAEMLAKKYNIALVFIHTKKVKRGYYNAEFELITDNPRNFKDFELTEKYLKMCEKQIIEKPDYYLWTHNRFKHVGKEHLSPAGTN